ncbi:hypothetical protein GH714_022305 [Hevea brasiliensis]|uniref:YTH domain-containing family protein n=1 Tax=Hevea brasiliensis TaxID=3981 RepID=A0A6A6N6A2_HEVBR|nr:hypothetical protein GH714_022305 [Hevea brasiliensis]
MKVKRLSFNLLWIPIFLVVVPTFTLRFGVWLLEKMDYHVAKHHSVALHGMPLLIPKVKEMVILVSKRRLTKRYNGSFTQLDDHGYFQADESHMVSTLGSDFSAGAKFYVIKSYNEDDIHKSIKYDAWASTPNGNKKLDAAFREAEQRSGGTGTKCPILLFFLVNGSGQFVGIAEVVGQVDFDKDMDFWQLRKWNGFFPVKWHVEKDIPNSHLRHIILENNVRGFEKRPVLLHNSFYLWKSSAICCAYGSPALKTQLSGIGLEQDLEMLNIFKSYSAKTSLLDDFNFYENQEKSLHTKKSNKPATLRMEIHENGDFLLD